MMVRHMGKGNGGALQVQGARAYVVEGETETETDRSKVGAGCPRLCSVRAHRKILRSFITLMVLHYLRSFIT